MPHIHEKVDFVTDIYIVNKGRVLLRKHDKYHVWLPPGGHIELDEDPPQAAIREVKEEVNLDIELVPAAPLKQFDDAKTVLTPRFIDRHRINETHEHVDFIYFATSKSDVIKQGNREISDDIRWLTSAELDDPALGIKERVKYYAREALKALS
ncbi:MAG TPA: NUDIX domain-containing protein [Candidatus Paceibacterota bacterium]|nr:NUDIX domain-containing protein [Candidatus Paceibacterota bacterium]